MRLIFAATFALTACAAPRAQSPGPIGQVGIAFTTQGEVGTFAEGFADRDAGRRITPDDPARVASVSKLAVAIGVMKLVEAGKLDLDRDVSSYLGFALRNPAFQNRPITLRMLMSHTSSARDHDDQYAIPLGSSVAQVMADPASWDPAHGPGDGYFTYANMNFPIVGSVIERATGERFDHYMRRAVFEPMGLDACFNWPTCSDAAVARAVVLYRDGKVVRDDLKGVRPDCPVYLNDGDRCDLSRWRAGENGSMFSPQGGMRISTRGLSRIGRMLLAGGTIDGVTILSPHSVDTLLHQGWRFDGSNGATENFYCSYGLATQQIPAGVPGCAEDPGTRGTTFVGHAGEAYGLRSGLWIDRASGRGIAYFLTDQPDSVTGNASNTPAEAAAFRRALALLPH
ncbi:MAG: serine hydrolase domain-containing protein [Sphingomicrobium sp.]